MTEIKQFNCHKCNKQEPVSTITHCYALKGKQSVEEADLFCKACQPKSQLIGILLTQTP